MEGLVSEVSNCQRNPSKKTVVIFFFKKNCNKIR